MIPELVATFASGIFFGAALYINLVEQPARVSCGVPLAVTEWRPSYKRGTLMQASLALIGSVAALLASWLQGSAGRLMGGSLFLLVVFFTLIIIFPDQQSVGESRPRHSLRRSGTPITAVGQASCGSHDS